MLISNPVSFQVHGAKNMIRIITRFLRSLPKWVFKDTAAGFKTMLSFSSIVFLLAGPNVRAQTDECDYFVSWVEAVKETYQETHRIYPVPARLKTQAIRYMPRLWVSPNILWIISKLRTSYAQLLMTLDLTIGSFLSNRLGR